MLRNTVAIIRKNEKFLFLLVVLLNLLPIFQGHFFPSMDGPAHLYNAGLIKELSLHPHAFLESYYQFNAVPVPNWSGHFVLAFFRLFLPGFLAEKLLLILYLVGLPYSFRAFIRVVNPASVSLSYLILPFTYSFLFILGFYNFCLGLICLFYILTFWVKNNPAGFSWKFILKLSLLLIITFFSHVFVFGFLMVLLSSYTIFNFLHQRIFKTAPLVTFRKQVAIPLSILLLSSILPLILFMVYWLQNSGSGANEYLSGEKLIQWFKNLQALISYDEAFEKSVFRKMLYLLIVTGAIATVIRGYELFRKSEVPFRERIANQLFSTREFWLLIALFLSVLYFVMPDSANAAGFISIRLLLFALFFFMTWLVIQRYPAWLSPLVVIPFLLFHFRLVQYYQTATEHPVNVSEACYQAGKHIPPNSVVLPVNFSNNWLFGHFSNYLGADKPMVILENYETAQAYFPLKWNTDAMPNLQIGKLQAGDLGCQNWLSNLQNPPRAIDYVFFLEPPTELTDSCWLKLTETLRKEYQIVYRSKYCTLFRFRKQK